MFQQAVHNEIPFVQMQQECHPAFFRLDGEVGGSSAPFRGCFVLDESEIGNERKVTLSRGCEIFSY